MQYRDHKLFYRINFPPGEESACTWGSNEGREGFLSICCDLVLFRVVFLEGVQRLSDI